VNVARYEARDLGGIAVRAGEVEVIRAASRRGEPTEQALPAVETEVPTPDARAHEEERCGGELLEMRDEIVAEHGVHDDRRR